MRRTAVGRAAAGRRPAIGRAGGSAGRRPAVRWHSGQPRSGGKRGRLLVPPRIPFLRHDRQTRHDRKPRNPRPPRPVRRARPVRQPRPLRRPRPVWRSGPDRRTRPSRRTRPRRKARRGPRTGPRTGQRAGRRTWPPWRIRHTGRIQPPRIRPLRQFGHNTATGSARRFLTSRGIPRFRRIRNRRRNRRPRTPPVLRTRRTLPRVHLIFIGHIGGLARRSRARRQRRGRWPAHRPGRCRRQEGHIHRPGPVLPGDLAGAGGEHRQRRHRREADQHRHHDHVAAGRAGEAVVLAVHPVEALAQHLEWRHGAVVVGQVRHACSSSEEKIQLDPFRSKG